MKKKLSIATFSAFVLMCGMLSVNASAYGETSGYKSHTSQSGSLIAKYTTGGWVAWDNHSFSASTGTLSGSVEIYAKDKSASTFETKNASGYKANASYSGGEWSAAINSYSSAVSGSNSAKTKVTNYD